MTPPVSLVASSCDSGPCRSRVVSTGLRIRFPPPSEAVTAPSGIDLPRHLLFYISVSDQKCLLNANNSS